MICGRHSPATHRHHPGPRRSSHTRGHRTQSKDAATAFCVKAKRGQRRTSGGDPNTIRSRIAAARAPRCLPHPPHQSSASPCRGRLDAGALRRRYQAARNAPSYARCRSTRCATTSVRWPSTAPRSSKSSRGWATPTSKRLRDTSTLAVKPTTRACSPTRSRVKPDGMHWSVATRRDEVSRARAAELG
jgi:hypothetical protein